MVGAAARLAALGVALGVVLACAVLLAPPPAAPLEISRGYDYYAVGDRGDAPSAATGGLVLMGGGTDVDAAFRWMIGRSGGGDFVVLRALGEDGYNPYVRRLGQVDSVETLVVRSRGAAMDPFVLSRIRNAEAVFIAGGDQWDYVRFWKDTPVEQAINHAAARGAPVGGTSAGLAILGGVVFSAENGTVYSNEALRNPYNQYMTFEREFLDLPNLDATITDSHFAERDRMGRLVAFVARSSKDHPASAARGIGVDEDTAVLVRPDGHASVRGGGAAYFLRASGPPESCSEGVPLEFRNVPVYRATASSAFDLVTWRGRGGTAYTVTVRDGKLQRSVPS